MRKIPLILSLALWFCLGGESLSARQVNDTSGLRALQQQFIDLKFGMFIHFNIPTFMEDRMTIGRILMPVRRSSIQLSWIVISGRRLPNRLKCVTVVLQPSTTVVFVSGIRKRPIIM